MSDSNRLSDPFGEDEQEPKNAKASTYNKEKYQANKDKILQYRKKRYKELNAYKYDIQINQGNFIISFD
jgi:hypothetical protein